MRLACLFVIFVALFSAGCGDGKSSSSTGSAGPSLDSSDPQERAAAAREAAKKYGAAP